MKRLLIAVSTVLLSVSVYARMPEEEINLSLSAEILAERNSVIYPGAEIRTVPLNRGDADLIVGWPDSVGGEWPMLRAALELYTWPTHMLDGTKSRFVDDPVIDGTEYPGRWRQATISRLRQPKRGSSDEFEYWIVLTLRSGYAETISWDEARLVEQKDSLSEATTLGANVIADTTGFATSQYAVVRWTSISPYKINACIASLSAEVYINPVVYGETLSGVWYNLMVTGSKDSDGAGVVDLVLSRQRFTIAAYDFYNTVRQATSYRIFGVPKTTAQAIIDDWQGDGRSASATYNDSTELCTVTLTDRDAAKDNLTTAWIYTGCDQKFRQSFAWGYTKTELDKWIDDNFTNAPSMPPYTRDLSVNDRGDGLFNATMLERTFEAVSTTAPQFTITLPVGTNITKQTDYGYNYNATNMAANAFKTNYNETVKAVGRTVDLRVTREDDCSFDWVAIITDQSRDILGDIDTGSSGVWRQSYSMRGATSTEVTNFAASVKSGPRTNITVDLNMRDDGLADVKAGVVVVQENTNTFDSSTNGVRVQVYSGANADALPTGIVSAARVRVNPQVTPLDDGTYNYGISKTTVQKATDSASTGSGGISRAVYAGGNVDIGDLSVLMTNNALQSSRLTNVTISLSVQDDDTERYTVNREVIQASSGSWAVGTKGQTVAVSLERNAASLSDPAISSASSAGRSVELSPTYDDAGNLNYIKRDIQQYTQTHSVTGGTYLSSVKYDGATGYTNDIPNATPQQGTSYVFKIQQNKDGTTDWSKQTASSQYRSSPDGTNAFVFSRLKPAWRNAGFAETGTLFRNSFTLPKNFSDTNSYGYYQNVDMNNDGTYDGIFVDVVYDEEEFYEAYPPTTNTSYTVNALAWDHMSRRGRQAYTNNDNGFEIYWYTTQTRKMYLEVPYTVTTSWKDTYGEALSFISGGMQESNVTLVDIGEAMKWKAEKWVLVGNSNTIWNAHGEWINTDAPAGYSPFSP